MVGGGEGEGVEAGGEWWDGHWVVYCGKRVGSKAAGLVAKAEEVQVAARVEGVDVGHHGCGTMDCGPVVHEEFLGPATELVAGSLVGGDGLDGIAIADPVEVAAPDVGVDDGEAPWTGCNFTDKGVVVGLGGGAPAGCHEDGLQVGGGKGFVKGDGGRVSSGEEGDGVGGSSGVFRLHADEGHAGLGPVGFEEGGERAIVTGSRTKGEWVCNGRCGLVRGGSDAGFEVGDEAGVEVEEANEGVEGLATGGYGPIADGVLFGGGRAVAIRVEVGLGRDGPEWCGKGWCRIAGLARQARRQWQMGWRSPGMERRGSVVEGVEWPCRSEGAGVTGSLGPKVERKAAGDSRKSKAP
eukprot:scaffold14635_cov201-Amphora_coffeaeformis.AAC.3